MSTDSAPIATDEASRITPELWWLSAIMALGGFASLLDSTIINVAIGPLATVFQSQLSTVQWVVTGYLLALCATIPLSGWAAERFGAKQTIIISQVVFLLGSLLSGLAWSASSLIVFRVIQGIGGGLVAPVGQALLAQAAGPKRLGRLMAIVSIPAMFAPVVGPSLGGVLVDHLSWRWIFFINVPLCLASIVLTVMKVDNVVAPSRASKLDFLGLALLMPGLTAFLYGLSEAGSGGGFGGAKALSGLLVGGVLLVAFALYSLRARLTPLLDLRLFGGRNFRYGTLASILLSMAMFGAMIPLPLYFQMVHGTSVLRSALLLLPQSAGYFTAIVLMARLTARLGTRNLTVLGVVLGVIGTIPYATIGAHPNELFLSGAMVVRGFGFGASMLPAMTIAYIGLSSEVVPRATSAFNVFQRVGASLGTAVLAVVLQQQVKDHLPTGVQKLTQVQPGSDIAQSLASSFGASFWWALMITALALVPSLFLPGQDFTKAPLQSVPPARESEPAI